MSVKYLVETLAQPTGWTCFHTCLVMLHRFRSQKSGIFHGPSELEAMLFPNSKQASARIAPAANIYLLGTGSTMAEIVSDIQRKHGHQPPSGLLSPAQARAFADRFGFAFSAIETEPRSFERILQRHGPFIWVGSLYHTVLITGIEERQSLFYVSFNDPNGGKKDKKEFYAFLLWLMPSMKQLGTQQFEVFHVRRT